jgi:hypothetical protein
MPTHLYDAGPNGLWVFVLCTVVLGGATAYVTGRAVAETWRPVLHVLVYCLLIAAAVRFLQFALFQAELTSWTSYLIDAAILIAAASAGYSLTRARIMASQYAWTRGDKGPT